MVELQESAHVLSNGAITRALLCVLEAGQRNCWRWQCLLIGLLHSNQPVSMKVMLVLARQQVLDTTRMEHGAVPTSCTVVGAKRVWQQNSLIRDSLLPSRASMAIMYPAPVGSWRSTFTIPCASRCVVRHAVSMWQLARGDSLKRAMQPNNNQVTELSDWLLSN